MPEPTTSDPTEVALAPVAVPAELVQAVERSGLAPASVQELLRAFAPHFAAFNDVEPFALGCPRDKPNVAREHRLKLKRIRVALEHTRKEQKDESLRFGRTVDDIARLLRVRIEPVEAGLDQIERAEEIARAARIAALQAERQEAFAPFAAFVSPADITNLGTLTDLQFAALLDRARAGKDAEDARIAAEAAERERQERERTAEMERIRAENARLQAERARMDRRWELLAPCAGFVTPLDRAAVPGMADAEFDAFLAHCQSLQAASDAAKAREEAERLAREEELRAQAERDRLEREAAEAELQAKRDAEAAAEAARAAEARRLAAAPDRDKLIAFAATVRQLPVPEMESEAGCAAADWIGRSLDRFADLVEQRAAALGEE